MLQPYHARNVGARARGCRRARRGLEIQMNGGGAQLQMLLKRRLILERQVLPPLGLDVFRAA